MKRVLIAGIGNTFLGDDAFGCEVIRELERRPLALEARVVDFGIRSYDLACALTEQYEFIILVDACPRGAAPGTVYLIEPDLQDLQNRGPIAPDAHTMNAGSVLQLAQLFGGVSGKVFLVGCEPKPAVTKDYNFQPGLSEPAGQALPQAVAMIESLLSGCLNSKTRADAGVVPA
jgi:hydrogenase maturation protease